MQTSHGMAMMLWYQSMFFFFLESNNDLCSVFEFTALKWAQETLQLWEASPEIHLQKKKKQHKTNRNQYKTWQQSKVTLRLLIIFLIFFFIRMKTLLTLVRRNLVRRSTTVLFFFLKAAFVRASFPCQCRDHID